jgi:hypothetical protein
MSETLFDYQNRLRDEEVLYLLRQLADYQGIIPFAERDRRRHVDPHWDGCVSEDPHAAVELVANDPGEKFEETIARAEEKTRRPRFDWMENDASIKHAEEARTGWSTRAKAMKDPKAIAKAMEKSNEYRKYAGRRRKKIETEIKKGRAEIVDGVLYDLSRGVRRPWDASEFPTK